MTRIPFTRPDGRSFGGLFDGIGWLSAREGTALAMDPKQDAQRRECSCGTIYYTSTDRQQCIRCQDAKPARLGNVVRMGDRL